MRRRGPRLRRAAVPVPGQLRHLQVRLRLRARAALGGPNALLRPHSRAARHLPSPPARARYVLPAVESLCRSCGHAAAAGDAAVTVDAAAAAAPPTQQPAVLLFKHCLRDEYDELTDIARLHRIKARCAA